MRVNAQVKNSKCLLSCLELSLSFHWNGYESQNSLKKFNSLQSDVIPFSVVWPFISPSGRSLTHVMVFFCCLWFNPDYAYGELGKSMV